MPEIMVSVQKPDPVEFEKPDPCSSFSIIERVDVMPGLQVPGEFYLGTLLDHRLAVEAPISVGISKSNDHFIAEAKEFTEFGYGASISEAIRDLQRTITELFLTLEEDEGRLGSDLREVWAVLQKRIRRRESSRVRSGDTEVRNDDS